MNRKILIFSVFALLTACWLGSCSKDDDSPVPEPVPEVHHVPLQVMIVFAPGQLGDGGYADKVFNGIRIIESLFEKLATDTINVNYISTYNRDATYAALLSWAESARNPFSGKDYDRRLLVLTEPFMIDWLDDIKDTLRQTDCVLMLKTSEALIDEAAERTGLGDRIHGLNISAASSIRNFCSRADSIVTWFSEQLDTDINHDVLPIFRLYGNDELDYQDSVYVTLQECFDDGTQVEVIPLSNNDYEGLYAPDGTSITVQAYNMAENMTSYANDYGYYFAIVDIGAAFTGWNYYVFGIRGSNFVSVQLDGSPDSLSDFYIVRHFDLAVVNWVNDWINNVENIPKMIWHGGWDGYCADNFSDHDL